MPICKSIENTQMTSTDGEKAKRNKYQKCPQPILINIRHLRSVSSPRYKRVGSLITAKRNPAVPVKQFRESSVPPVQNCVIIPNEILTEIFSRILASDCGIKSLLNMRVVCRTWNSLITGSKLLTKQLQTFKVSRLIISYDLQRNMYEFRWCNYETRDSRSLTLSRKQLKRPSNFSLAFCRLNIQRILFQNLPSGSLNDALLNFLCQQFQNCLVFKPKCITAKNISMKAVSSNGLMKLLSVCSKSLESVQFHGISGLRPSSITDIHLAVLDPAKLRSLTIEKVSFEPIYKNRPLLQIGDKSLERFSRVGYFPTLILEKCRVTATMVCQYTEKWLAKKSTESELRNLVDVKSHMFVLKDSPAADNVKFERECRRRSLDFEQPAADFGNQFGIPVANSCDESETISYNVHKDEAHQEFTVTLSTASAMYE